MIFKSISRVALAALALCAGAAQADGFANGGFEVANSAPNPPGGATFFAEAWLASPTGFPALWSTDAHTGSHSAALSVPTGFGGSTLFQNSMDQGKLPAMVAGNTPTLTFWAKGDVGPTGNVLFALRYLDGTGNILYNSGNQFFQSKINPSSWSMISYTGGVIPTNAVAAFLEMNTATGPGATLVKIDDINLSPVPEPETYALMLAGLAGVGAMVRRRRAV